MNSDDIRRIAEIVFGVENVKDNNDGSVVCVRLNSGHWLWFRPDLHWESTGMLLEWLHRSEPEILIDYDDEDHHSIFKYNFNTSSDDLLGRGETLQLAICNAVLSVGEFNN